MPYTSWIIIPNCLNHCSNSAGMGAAAGCWLLLHQGPALFGLFFLTIELRWNLEGVIKFFLGHLLKSSLEILPQMRSTKNRCGFESVKVFHRSAIAQEILLLGIWPCWVAPPCARPRPRAANMKNNRGLLSLATLCLPEYPSAAVAANAELLNEIMAFGHARGAAGVEQWSSEVIRHLQRYILSDGWILREPIVPKDPSFIP